VGGALRAHRRGRRPPPGVAARPPAALAPDRAAARAHGLHAVRRLADPRVRAAVPQVPRALERPRAVERRQGGRQGGPRPRPRRDRRRAHDGALSMVRLRGGAVRPGPPPVLLCRWDLDKTYLRSEFETVRQLLRTAFERAEDKVEVPGVAEVIKGIGDTAARQRRRALVYFLSASPPQIGRAIRDKLALDGVPYDGIVFKDQLGYLRRGRLRGLREHVGFKLVHLLRGRLEAPLEARELLFGDDWESDSLIYALYADVLGGRIGGDRLRHVLERIGVEAKLIVNVLALP